MNVLRETFPELTDGSSFRVDDSPHAPCPVDCTSTDVEAEETCVSVDPTRRSQRLRQKPEQYAYIRSVPSNQYVANSFVTSILPLRGLLLVVGDCSSQSGRRGSHYSDRDELCGEYR